jgi:hypothetical protein
LAFALPESLGWLGRGITGKFSKALFEGVFPMPIVYAADGLFLGVADHDGVHIRELFFYLLVNLAAVLDRGNNNLPVMFSCSVDNSPIPYS